METNEAPQATVKPTVQEKVDLVLRAVVTQSVKYSAHHDDFTCPYCFATNRVKGNVQHCNDCIVLVATNLLSGN